MKNYLILLVFPFFVSCHTRDELTMHLEDGQTYQIWGTTHSWGDDWESDLLWVDDNIWRFPRRIKKIIAIYAANISDYLLVEWMGEYLADVLGGYSSLEEADAGWRGRRPPNMQFTSPFPYFPTEIRREGNKVLVMNDKRTDVFVLRWWGGVSYRETYYHE